MPCRREGQIPRLRGRGRRCRSRRRVKTPTTGGKRRIGTRLTGVKRVGSRQGVGVVFASARHVHPSLIFLVHALRLCIHESIHGVVGRVTIAIFILRETPHA